MVQYQGATVAGNNAHFQLGSIFGSNSGQGGNRAPDLKLKPYEEGVSFTLRLLAANGMAKVVELQLQPSDKKLFLLSQQDIQQLFQAMGSKHGNDDDDNSDDDDDDEVMDEYKPLDADAKLLAGKGLVYLESLAILGSKDNSGDQDCSPSLIRELTAFLLSTHQFPRFTSLSLQQVNLNGTALELRALSEAFRLHPRLARVQMTACHFSPEQHDNMQALQQVFQEAADKNGNNNRASAMGFGSASPPTLQELGTKYQNTNTNANATNATQWSLDMYQDDSNQKHNKDAKLNMEGLWWGERLFKSCFCWW